MQRTPLKPENCVFFVEGRMEAEFLRSVCPHLHNRIVGNGSDVSAAKIAEQVSAVYSALSKTKRHIIVIIDLEKRKVLAEKFAAEVRNLLLARCKEASTILVGCPNKMIENWILADSENISRYLEEQVDASIFSEGVNGKARLSQVFKDCGRRYVETADGVALLKSINLGLLKRKSLSARSFFDELVLPCWWLDRQPQDD